jgi:uncharacterized protein YbjT (DUF2867 family)
MKAFVAGATGQTGQRIVKALIQRQIPVRALVRDTAVARTVLPSEVELVVGDVLDAAQLKAGLGDSTVLLCATGARPSFDPTGPYKVDYEGTKNLVDAAKSQGIEHFVFVSSLCVSQLLHPLNLFWLILVWKKQAEEYLRKSGLTYTIVRPGGLRNDENAFPLLMKQADSLFEGNIPRTKVAEVCVEALFSPEAHNKTVEIITKADAPGQSFSELFGAIPSATA